MHLVNIGRMKLIRLPLIFFTIDPDLKLSAKTVETVIDGQDFVNTGINPGVNDEL
jgi:hypothetical protein